MTSGKCGARNSSVVVAIAAMAFLGLNERGGRGAEAGSACPFLWQRRAAFHGRVHGVRDRAGGKMGDRVDLDEVSLDMARYADRDMQEAIVDYLQKRQAKWQPDLVVPIGSPAAIFVANYRDRLFPETPILYASADRRLLPPGALEKNAAYVGQDI